MTRLDIANAVRAVTIFARRTGDATLEGCRERHTVPSRHTKDSDSANKAEDKDTCAKGNW